ncbi:hypothetical protein V1511DRAFT_500245 [Dipodascopsis uninucleata]
MASPRREGSELDSKESKEQETDVHLTEEDKLKSNEEKILYGLNSSPESPARKSLHAPYATSLLPSYSRPPKDAVTIHRPNTKRQGVINIRSFTPLDTFDRAPKLKVFQQMKKADAGASPSLPSRSNSNKRKPDENGELEIKKRHDSSSSPQRLLSHENRNNNTLNTIDIDNDTDETQVQSPSKLSIKPKPSYANFTEHSLKLNLVEFGKFSSFKSDKQVTVITKPKRIESELAIRGSDEKVSEILRFQSPQLYKLVYCLESLDVIIRLKSRHTLKNIDATSDSVHIRADSTEIELIQFAQNVEDIFQKTETMGATSMNIMLGNMGYTTTTGEVVSKYFQHPKQKYGSPQKDHFGMSSPSYDQKNSSLEKSSPSNSKTVTSDNFNTTWQNNESDYKRVTRSASGTRRKLIDETKEFDLTQSDKNDTTVKSNRPKLHLGTPLRYSFNKKTVVVNEDDFSRLDDGEFLNDTIIDFYLKYVFNRLQTRNPEIASKTYIYNTFFFNRLTQRVNGVKGSFENVKKWTSKVDIFEKKYIIMPIHERAHWYVAIICNLCNIDKSKESIVSDQKPTTIDDDGNLSLSPLRRSSFRRDALTPEDPIIFVFDSLKLKHNTIFRPLRDYLVAEAMDKRGYSLEGSQIKSKYGYAPTQPNYCDCGVYVAHYVETFLEKPEAFLPLLVDGQNDKKLVMEQLDKLWNTDKLHEKRLYMQKLIIDLKREAESRSEETSCTSDHSTDSPMKEDNTVVSPGISEACNNSFSGDDDSEAISEIPLTGTVSTSKSTAESTELEHMDLRE